MASWNVGKKAQSFHHKKTHFYKQVSLKEYDLGHKKEVEDWREK